jgi:uncharacterized small protein (DUF1192 family)
MTSFASIGRIADAPNASQGFKRHCAMAELRGSKPFSFQEFLARHGKNWPTATVEVDEQAERIAALEAELAALRGESKPSKPRARKPKAAIAVGATFRYTRGDGTTTDREILAINEDGSLQVRNLEYGVISKRPWRGIERQLKGGNVVIL